MKRPRRQLHQCVGGVSMYYSGFRPRTTRTIATMDPRACPGVMPTETPPAAAEVLDAHSEDEYSRGAASPQRMRPYEDEDCGAIDDVYHPRQRPRLYDDETTNVSSHRQRVCDGNNDDSEGDDADAAPLLWSPDASARLPPTAAGRAGGGGRACDSDWLHRRLSQRASVHDRLQSQWLCPLLQSDTTASVPQLLQADRIAGSVIAGTGATNEDVNTVSQLAELFSYLSLPQLADRPDAEKCLLMLRYYGTEKPGQIEESSAQRMSVADDVGDRLSWL